MEAGFIFITDRHPGSDGLTRFLDNLDTKRDSAPFDLKDLAFKRQGHRRSAHHLAFVNNVHNYCYPPQGLAATRGFLAAAGKTPGLSLEAQAGER